MIYLKILLTGVLLSANILYDGKVKGISQETLCLAFVVADEARGEPVKGQRAVLDVVLKRMEVRNLSACEVVMEKSQFSGYKPGMTFELHKNVQEKDLTRLYELRSLGRQCINCTHFHSTYTEPFWSRKFKMVKKIGKHVFLMEEK